MSVSESAHQYTMTKSPTLLVLYGYPGCGKLTTATALTSLLPDFKLFHNHLVVDMLFKLFPFGTPSFKKYREQIWMDLIPEAARNGDNVIFTFAFEDSVSEGFLERLQLAFEEAATTPAAGTESTQGQEGVVSSKSRGKVLFIDLQCDVDTVRQRLTTESRKEFGKLTSLDVFNNALAAGAFEVKQPKAHLKIDVSKSSAVESAEKIYDLVQSCAV